jgi:hypothetical protein
VRGDIDGDPYEEIVLNGECLGFDPAWAVTALKYNPASEDIEWMDFSFFGPEGISYQPTLAVLDYDGDDRNEIFASRDLYAINPDANQGYGYIYHSEAIRRLQRHLHDLPGQRGRRLARLCVHRSARAPLL